MNPHFDLVKGIWYPISLSILLLIILIFMPKKINKQEIYISFGVIGYLVWMVDMTLAAPFNIFDIGTKSDGLPELLLYGFIPSCIAVIFLNFYDRTNKKNLLSILFTIISLLLEWFADLTGIMTSNIWKLYYTIPVFTIVFFLCLPWHLKFIRKTNSR